MKNIIKYFIPLGIICLYKFICNNYFKHNTTQNKPDTNFSIITQKNEKCVVLANGPSLSKTLTDKLEYDFIKKHKKFCMNSFPLTEWFFELKPEYICYMDPDYWSVKPTEREQKTLLKLYAVFEKIDWEIIVFFQKTQKIAIF